MSTVTNVAVRSILTMLADPSASTSSVRPLSDKKTVAFMPPVDFRESLAEQVKDGDQAWDTLEAYLWMLEKGFTSPCDDEGFALPLVARIEFYYSRKKTGEELARGTVLYNVDGLELLRIRYPLLSGRQLGLEPLLAEAILKVFEVPGWLMNSIFDALDDSDYHVAFSRERYDKSGTVVGISLSGEWMIVV